MDSTRAQIVTFMIIMIAILGEAVAVDKLVVPVIPRLAILVAIATIQMIFIAPMICKKLEAI